MANASDSLNLGQLDLTSEDYLLDEIEDCIQANLEDEIVKDALRKGVDLRQYSKQVETELTSYENASIDDYIKESQNIAKLHKQIVSCDNVLERIEDMLKDFQQHLSSISSDIQSLQQQSIEMNVQLKNKQAVRSELSQYVDEMVVPEVMISHILDTAVTEREFIEQLHELNHKINFVKEQSFRDAKSCHDVCDILEKLKWKAVEKIREFLLDKIYQFRKPLTNYQIPQNIMLKHGFFNEFLMTHERQVAKDIKDEYVDTTSKIYYSYFKGYVSRLVKLQLDDAADKDDLMGVDDSAKRGFFSSKPTLKNKGTVFSLGNRGAVLSSDLEAPAIVPHAAQKSEQRFSLETLFRSHQFALMDNTCHEYFFISDFFFASGSSAMELFNHIFGRTLTMFQKLLETQVMESYDSIGLFLCLHISYKYQVIMNKRGVPALDKYWETIQELIGPRVEYLLQLHIQSVKECDVQKLGHFDSRPHYIPRRYAEFAAAFLSINDGQPNDRISQFMSRLQYEVDSLVHRLAREFANKKQQLIFLINNYDMIVATISEKVTTENRDLENLKAQLSSKTQEYVDEILTPNFGGLMSFVREVEVVIESGGQIDISRYERRVTQIVKSFNAEWKKAIDQMSQELMMSFVNFKNGQQILQASLTQMIQYYHRFQVILGQPPFKTLPVRNEAINIHQVMVEVKKHKATF